MHIHDPIESRIHECDLCGKSFSRKSSLKVHYHYHQTKKAYDKSLDKRLTKTPCPICQKEYAIFLLKEKTHHRTHFNLEIISFLG